MISLLCHELVWVKNKAWLCSRNGLLSCSTVLHRRETENASKRGDWNFNASPVSFSPGECYFLVGAIDQLVWEPPSDTLYNGRFFYYATSKISTAFIHYCLKEGRYRYIQIYLNVHITANNSTGNLSSKLLSVSD